MEVWDDRRSDPASRGRIRRSWSERAKLFVEIVGGIALAIGFFGGLMTSMGFKVSGSGEAIASIRATDVAQDTAIAQIRRANDVVTSRLDDIVYLVCEQTKRNQRGIILPRSCK